MNVGRFLVLVVFVSVVALISCTATQAAIVSEVSLTSVSDGGVYDITAVGSLDWAVSGANRKAGGSTISTLNGGLDTVLVSGNGGGTKLSRGEHLFFLSYTDGTSPSSSLGQDAAYQFDEPAVDITLPAGSGTITVWFHAGWLNTFSYSATFASGIGNTNILSRNVPYFGSPLSYQLQLAYDTDSTQSLTFSLDHPGDPSDANNVGLSAVAVEGTTSAVPEPSSIVVWSSLGAVGAVMALRRRLRCKVA
jgi:hypothetical protein